MANMEEIVATHKATQILITKKAEFDEFKDISTKLAEVKAELATICRDINNKTRESKTLQSDIDSYAFTLSKMTERFEKDTAERARVLVAKQKEVAEASSEYQWLLKGVRDKTDELSFNLSTLEQSKQGYIAECKKWEIYAQTVESEANKRVIDVETREILLAEERKSFEEYKATIGPELSRVSEIRNENLILKTKLDERTSHLENEEKHIENQKEKMMLEIEGEKEKVRKSLIEIGQREENLAKQHQELADLELEVRAREADANKTIKRYQLEQKIKEK